MGRLVSWRFVLVAGLCLAVVPLAGSELARADGPARADGALRDLGLLLRGVPAVVAAAVLARRPGPGYWAPRVFVNMALAGTAGALLGLLAHAAGVGAPVRLAPIWLALAPALGVLTGVVALPLGWLARRGTA